MALYHAGLARLRILPSDGIELELGGMIAQRHSDDREVQLPGPNGTMVSDAYATDEETRVDASLGFEIGDDRAVWVGAQGRLLGDTSIWAGSVGIGF